MDVTFVLFLLCSRFKYSFVIVVFDFSASLNDAAPVSPIFLSVDAVQNKSMKSHLFHIGEIIFKQGRHPTLNSLHGTMFIKRQILSIVNSPSIRPVTQRLKCSEALFHETKQTPIFNAHLPFPLVEEPHQTQCFMVSFVCSLAKQ